MKKILILLPLLIPFVISAQISSITITGQPSNTFPKVKATLKQYIDSLEPPPIPTGFEEGQHEKLEEWSAFWEARTCSNPEPNENIFQEYKKRAQSFLFDRQNLCNSNLNTNIPFRGNWKCLGPFEDIQGMQALGVVLGIWADPNNENKIIVSTLGGLFLRENATAHWRNISDNTEFVQGLSNTVFDVNPLNTQNIVASSYIQKGNKFTWADGVQYGSGLYTSSDLGTNWTKDVSFDNFLSANSLNPNAEIHEIHFAPNTNILYIVSGNSLYRKKNGIWENITPSGMNGANLHKLKFNKANPNTYYISSFWETIHFQPSELWKHEIVNNMDVWTNLTPNLPWDIPVGAIGKRYSMDVSPLNDNSLYVIAAISSNLSNIIKYKIFYYDFCDSQWSVRNSSINTNNDPQFGMESIEANTSIQINHFVIPFLIFQMMEE
ncbi:MAG: hypothetical protein R2831_05810 [Chitinophagaceae bacterium]